MAADLSEFQTPEVSRKVLVGKIADLVERAGLSPDDIGKITRVNLWQGMSKDDDGEAQVTDLVGISLSPAWAEGPQWPTVQPAKPTTVRHTKRPPVKHAGRVTVLLPDPQIGYRRFGDGTLDPMHDELAMACAVELLAVIHPNAVGNLGDFLDASEWSSKFVVQPEFVLTTQPALDRGHEFLAQQRAAVGPDADIWLIGGNHDDRLGIAVTRNAMAALRLRPGGTPPDTWPVLSIPSLLDLAPLDVRYIGGYPAGRVKVAAANGHQSPLVAQHGQKLDMRKQATGARQSTVQGHAHHVACHTETYEVDGEAVEVQSWSLGCLCRRDGAVPSTNGGEDEFGRHIHHVESWQHCVGVVTETEHGWWLEPVMIHDGRAVWRDREVTA